MNGVAEQDLPATRPDADPPEPGQAVDLSPQQAQAVVRLLEVAPSVWRRHQFFHWAQSQLHALLPHQILVCGAYQRQHRTVAFDVFHSVVLSEEVLAIFADGASALMRSATAAWVEGLGRPLVLDLICLAGDAQAQALRLQQESGIAHLLVHGVARPHRPAEIESLFVFAGIEAEPAGAPRAVHLELLVPYLHSIWRRVQALEFDLRDADADTDAVPAAAMTATVATVAPVRRWASTPLHDVTRREREILFWARGGMSNQQIADQLGISSCTAKNHVQKILRKLGARNRAHAVALAITHNLLDVLDVPA